MTRQSRDADVIVVGLGVMGGLALWRLARRGVRAVGVEQFGLGHDRGSSHGESKIIRTAYWEGADYVPLAERSWELWRELDGRSAAPILTHTGALMLGAADSPVITGAVASAEEHGLGYELLDPADLRRRYPGHVAGPGVTAFREERAGLVRAEPAVRAAAAAARDAGATIMEHQRVTAIVPDADRPRVRLGSGRELTASHVVVTAGPWVPGLLDAPLPPLRPVRRVMGWFAVDEPRLFRPEAFCVFVRGTGDGDGNWYGFPSLDGRTVKIGLHTWPDQDEPVDPGSGPRPPDGADAELLGAVATGGLRGAAPRPVRMQACTYTMTPDHDFVVGHGEAGGHPGVTVLAGFSGHGFKFAPVLGEIAADLALTARTGHPIGRFDPRRFARAERD